MIPSLLDPLVHNNIISLVVSSPNNKQKFPLLFPTIIWKEISCELNMAIDYSTYARTDDNVKWFVLDAKQYDHLN